MEALTNFLAGIGEMIFTIFVFLVDSVQNTVYVFKLLGYFASNLDTYFSWLPQEFGILIVLILGIAITLRALKWE